ncbi:MAG TPA: DUF1223 domain-containing protein [Candidatus Acidoferrum sp.]|nr:DUF1223 domain-containing protein [Candidatus Acidoferrum sp.]
MSRTNIFILLAVLAAAVVGAAAAPAQDNQDKAAVVVELFTSEGCSSCPPADAFLGELTKRPAIVPLAFHVDYWDYIGWKDPYASPLATQRQHDYATALGLHMVYTPQMVVDGHTDVVGSERGAVAAAIDKAAGLPKLAIAIEKDAGGGYRVAIAAAAPPAGGPATVWLALFDSQQETPVKRGENGGRTLKEYNIVREWRQIATWNGSALSLPLAMTGKPAQDGCAIIVQSGAVGPILGAAVMKLDDDSRS